MNVLACRIELQGAHLGGSVINRFVVVQDVVAGDLPPVVDDREPLKVVGGVPEVGLVVVTYLDGALVVNEEVKGYDLFAY